MGTLKGSKVSSDRQKWQKVFDALVHMLRAQQTQIESLANERKLLEDGIKLLHDRWVSDVNLLKDQISQLKRDLSVEEMAHKVDALKLDLLLGLKHREAFTYKIKLDDTVSELADYRVWFDYLSQKCGETKDNSSEILPLLSERDFIWNQYKKTERDLTDQLRSKSTEVVKANEKIQELLATMEQLQSSNSEKETMILELKKNMAQLEPTSVKQSEEISRLSKELQLLRKTRSASVTPVLRSCSTESTLREKNRGTDAKNIPVKNESHPSQVREKERGGSKRKAIDAIPISDTPKLFTSMFKVPKLKNSSPHVL